MKTSPKILWWTRNIYEIRHPIRISILSRITQLTYFYQTWIQKCSKTSTEVRYYQRGPRGGGTSRVVNPLMHWATSPSPTLRTYWWNHPKREEKTKIEEVRIRYFRRSQCVKISTIANNALHVSTSINRKRDTHAHQWSYHRMPKKLK